MPHDLNNNIIKVGDIINLRCKVLEIHQTEEFCNCNLETEIPIYPSNDRTFITVNTKQVSKVS